MFGLCSSARYIKFCKIPVHVITCGEAEGHRELGVVVLLLLLLLLSENKMSLGHTPKLICFFHVTN